MRAIGHPQSIRDKQAARVHMDAQTELARHFFDLLVHAVIMLLGAALSVYCGFLVCEAIIAPTLVGVAPVAIQNSLFSFGALAVFLVIAALCLFEGHRCWRKASIGLARTALYTAKKGPSDPAPDTRRGGPQDEATSASFSDFRLLRAYCFRAH